MKRSTAAGVSRETKLGGGVGWGIRHPRIARTLAAGSVLMGLSPGAAAAQDGVASLRQLEAHLDAARAAAVHLLSPRAFERAQDRFDDATRRSDRDRLSPPGGGRAETSTSPGICLLRRSRRILSQTARAAVDDAMRRWNPSNSSCRDLPWNAQRLGFSRYSVTSS